MTGPELVLLILRYTVFMVTEKTKQIDLLRQKAKRLFRENKQVASPAFAKEKITFNAKGVNHLFYKNPRNIRKLREIETRIDLVPSAVKLLKLLPVYQEESSYKFKGKVIAFWSFEGVIDGKRIKVIIKQVGHGKKHFWSVIPNWRRNRFGKKLNSKGNLAKVD